MKRPIPKPVSETWRPDLVRLPVLTPARRAFRAFAHGLIKFVVACCADVQREGLENIPDEGPLLVILNHLGDADAPVLVSSLPHPPDALGKVELYDLPVLGKLMDFYGIIWLHRGRADTKALRAALDGLAHGRIIAIAPEGRYSLTGALEAGSGGAAFLALKSGAPILPVAVTGTENDKLYGAMKRLRRAKVRVRIGQPFRLDAVPGAQHEALAEGTRRIMQSLADLLPEEYRGAYSS